MNLLWLALPREQGTGTTRCAGSAPKSRWAAAAGPAPLIVMVHGLSQTSVDSRCPSTSVPWARLPLYPLSSSGQPSPALAPSPRAVLMPTPGQGTSSCAGLPQPPQTTQEQGNTSISMAGPRATAHPAPPDLSRASRRSGRPKLAVAVLPAGPQSAEPGARGCGWLPPSALVYMETSRES